MVFTEQEKKNSNFNSSTILEFNTTLYTKKETH